MKKIRNPFKHLNKFDWTLWICSMAAVVASFFAVGSTDWLTLVTSVVGVTSLIFAAKGDFFGLILMLAFSIIYAVVSFFFRYYGESITYIVMEFPTCLVSLISWLRHPASDDGAEVRVGRIKAKHIIILVVLAAAIGVAFYYILRALNTENLEVSTVSVVTSFAALYLMALRIPAYAAMYAVNDIVLITLWSLACVQSIYYLPMVVCFAVFLINDIYGFILWLMRSKKQKGPAPESEGPEEMPK
ncbi:MAG: nicotinamide riboside transporter PnuC [Clostridia bacterium]|nr:nicotinamide riboside transporter PnuC [Clostridia bacterium]